MIAPRPALFLALPALFAVFCGCQSPDVSRKHDAVFVGFAVEGHPVGERQISDLPGIGGGRPDIILFYVQWPPPGSISSAGFPRESVKRIGDAGAIPCVTWEPMYIDGDREVMLSASAVTGGVYDAYIRGFAEEAGRWGKPVLVRFAHEMNLGRYHWGTAAGEYGPGSPAAYRAMYRHVVETARAAGGSNLLWVFCPNAESVPAGAQGSSSSWNCASNYYPGAEYVDVLGLDGYDWGHTRTREKDGWTSQPRSFEQIFGVPAREIRAIAPSKPLFVFETASVGNAEQKRAWFRDAVRSCSQQGISGLVWFQVKKENDWSLSGSGDGAAGGRGGGRGKALAERLMELKR